MRSVVRGTVSRARGTGRRAEVLAVADAGGYRGRRRGRWVAAGLVVVVAAGAMSAWWAGVFSASRSSGPGRQGAPAPATAAVQRRDVSATTPVSATLGYAGSFVVKGRGGGTLTWLPYDGKVIRQGHVLYKTDNGSPVVLLYGSVPAWRALGEGVTGADVTQLNHDLVALGDASSSETSALGWNYFSWETRAGVERLQSDLGISFPSGLLSLGSVVFEPEALRVSRVIASLGDPASGPVLDATSARHVATIRLDASEQTEVKVRDKVTVTLPDGNTAPGVISSVGKVASTSGSGPDATTTIPVQVKLTHPKAAGSLDQAPVQVNLTTSSVHHALAVPVGALQARSPAGYVVEVIGAGNARRYVPVRPGIFDDVTGLVQVTGALSPGQRVVAPAT
jgi:hypothetical protein